MRKRFSGSPDTNSKSKNISSRLEFSQHALQRMKKRSISEKDVIRVFRYGLVDDVEDDCIVRYIPESPFFNTESERIEQLKGCRVIVSRDGVVVTVMWKED